MHPRLHFVIAALAALSPISGLAAPAANLDQEYDQVRRIALRDPKVKAAFEKANQRLEAKIVEIDPALKGYVNGRSNAMPTTSSSSAESTPPRKSFVKPSRSAPPAAHETTHVISSGDTLSTIAARYKVAVVDLKAANPTIDEKKLQVGERLTIPSHHQRLTKPEPARTSTWDRLKSKF